MRILVTGARSTGALEWVRLLAKLRKQSIHFCDLKIFTADTQHFSLAGYSNATDRHVVYASPRFRPADFSRDLIQHVLDLKIDLIIPTCEEIFYISELESRLKEKRPFVKIYANTTSILMELHDKSKFNSVAKTIGQVPITQEIQPTSQLSNIIDFYRARSIKQLVFKPSLSRFASKVFFLNLRQPKELIISTLENEIQNSRYPLTVQEFIEGTEYCSFALTSKGKVLRNVSYRPALRAGRGAGILLTTPDPRIQKKIDEWVNRFTAQQSLTGQMAFDFIYQPNRDVIYPIECNPRTTSGIHFINSRDIELILKDLDIAPKTKIENDTQSASQYEFTEPATYKLTTAILLFLFSNLRELQKAPNLFGAIRKSRDMVFRTDDLKPGIIQFFLPFYYLALSLKTKRSLLEATTYDIERNV